MEGCFEHYPTAKGIGASCINTFQLLNRTILSTHLCFAINALDTCLHGMMLSRILNGMVLLLLHCLCSMLYDWGWGLRRSTTCSTTCSTTRSTTQHHTQHAHQELASRDCKVGTICLPRSILMLTRTRSIISVTSSRYVRS